MHVQACWAIYSLVTFLILPLKQSHILVEVRIQETFTRPTESFFSDMLSRLINK